MRYGMNALNVIDGVKKKIAEIKPRFLPALRLSPVMTGQD